VKSEEGKRKEKEIREKREASKSEEEKRKENGKKGRLQRAKKKHCDLLLNRSLFTHGQSGYQELAIPKASLFKQIKPNLNVMTTFLTIFTFTHAIKCTTKYYNITKLKKKIFKTGLCKTRRTKISERSYH
jgi:hypothetical protein